MTRAEHAEFGASPSGLLRRRAVFGWGCFDFANSPFTTLIVTFIYSTFFAQVIAPENGGSLWARGVAISAVAVALLAPVLGAVADRGGRRKPLLFVFVAVCIACTSMLFFSQPGDVTRTLVLFVIANVAFEMGHVFYNAFLPDIATSKNMGRVSGFGWALGYLGGLLALVLCYVGLVAPEEPWFGIEQEYVRSSAWFPAGAARRVFCRAARRLTACVVAQHVV